MKIKKFMYIIGATVASSSLLLAGCGKKRQIETAPVVETTQSDDEFTEKAAISEAGNGTYVDANGETKVANDGSIIDESETETQLSVAEQEESIANAAYESAVAQEESEYQAYINSDETYDFYLTYDRTEGDILYFTDDIPEESGNVEIGETEETIPVQEYKISKSNISGDVQALQHGDEALISYNGAITDDNELLKVYSIKNQTEIDKAEESSLAARESLEESAEEAGVELSEEEESESTN